MEEKNGLNDIILNKSSKNNSTKKILLTIATFAIILIIVIVVMNQVSGKNESALPHVPKTAEVTVEEVVLEPELETNDATIPVIESSIEHTSELVEEDESSDSKHVAPDGKSETERIMEAAFVEPEVIEEPDYTSNQKSTTQQPIQKEKPKQVLKPKKVTPSGKYDSKKKRVVHQKPASVAATGNYYIQVGSFATYAPAKSFLNKITNRGYTYTFHKVTRNSKTLNKVLVGPFKTQSAAREALPVIKKSVEPGAFLTKI